MGFQVKVLKAILPVEDRKFLDTHLYNLESAGFIHEVVSKRKNDRRFRFTHTTIQEALYNLLLFSQRRKLHRAIAEYYEKNNIPVFTLLANHWLNSLEKGVLGSLVLSSLLQGALDDDYIAAVNKVMKYATKISKQTKKPTATQEAQNCYNKLLAMLKTVKTTEENKIRLQDLEKKVQTKKKLLAKKQKKKAANSNKQQATPAPTRMKRSSSATSLASTMSMRSTRTTASMSKKKGAYTSPYAATPQTNRAKGKTSAKKA